MSVLPCTDFLMSYLLLYSMLGLAYIVYVVGIGEVLFTGYSTLDLAEEER